MKWTMTPRPSGGRRTAAQGDARRQSRNDLDLFMGQATCERRWSGGEGRESLSLGVEEAGKAVSPGQRRVANGANLSEEPARKSPWIVF
jgi:hypothetical protein